ncbi:MAG: hypothetical protein QM737_02210 [Ferruginibacter sp.]
METNQEKSIFELGFTDEGKSNFSSIAQWASINAIIGFVGIGMTVLSSFMASSRLVGAAKTANMITVFFTIVISLLLNITLIGAANNLKKGLIGSDQGYFNLGMMKMASYFKIIGILMIVCLSFFTLMMIIGIMAGAMGGFK